MYTTTFLVVTNTSERKRTTTRLLDNSNDASISHISSKGARSFATSHGLRGTSVVYPVFSRLSKDCSGISVSWGKDLPEGSECWAEKVPTVEDFTLK
jgi:hypothetical protein